MTPRRPLLLLPAVLLASCSPKLPPPPALNLTIICGADQNPDANGRPSPVSVQLYYLAASGTFERSDVFALTERGRITLAEDLLGSETFVLSAGETRVFDRVPKMGVQFLGVTVLFRDIDHATWRAIKPVAASGPTKLQLRIAGITATMEPVK